MQKQKIERIEREKATVLTFLYSVDEKERTSEFVLEIKGEQRAYLSLHYAQMPNTAL